MRALAALVTALAATAGWSDTEAAEAGITDFGFNCTTPDGRKLKPKFGDVEGVFYTDIPAQREQCLEAVKRKIALCRENTSFESNTKNEMYAECLPIFREQAQACVGHFQREQVKCDGGGRETETPPTVALQLKCAELSGQYLLENHTECWEEFENRAGCYWWNVHYHSDRTATLSSGRCGGRVVTGRGTISISAGSEHPSEEYRGEWRDGKLQGHGTFTSRRGSYEGGWRDGKRHGHGTRTSRLGIRYEGEYRDGKKHGYWTVTHPDGRRKTCEYRDEGRECTAYE